MPEGARFEIASEGSVLERLSAGESKLGSDSGLGFGGVDVSGMGFAEGEQLRKVVGIDLGEWPEWGFGGNALRGVSRRSEVAIGDWALTAEGPSLLGVEFQYQEDNEIDG